MDGQVAPAHHLNVFEGLRGPGQVLHLDPAASPAAGPLCAGELERVAEPVIGPYGLEHGPILRQGLLVTRQALLEDRYQYVAKAGVIGFAHGLLDRVLLQVLERVPALLQPGQQLRRRVGVRQAGDLLHLGDDLRLARGREGDGLLGVVYVDQDATVIDTLVGRVDLPLELGYRVLDEPALDEPLGDHVLAVVRAKTAPLDRVSGPVAPDVRVSLGDLLGFGEKVDEGLALFQLGHIARDIGRLAYLIQGAEKAHHVGQSLGAAPALILLRDAP